MMEQDKAEEPLDKNNSPNLKTQNNSHNTEELRAGVGKEIKPVVKPLRDKELSRSGGRIPDLTSPCDISQNLNKESQDG